MIDIIQIDTANRRDAQQNLARSGARARLDEAMRRQGFAGLPTWSRVQGGMQFMFVNGRPVRDKLLAGGIRFAEIQKKGGGAFSGLTFVFTGILPTLTRDEAKRLFASLGEPAPAIDALVRSLRLDGAIRIPELVDRVLLTLECGQLSGELLLVDDGSTDQTPQLLKEAMQRLPWLRVIRMAKNGGQSAAFEAGFEAARGEHRIPRGNADVAQARVDALLARLP